MNKRKERTHHCGFTNIDFRSKNDLENLKIHQPWHQRTNFGTMGYSEYKLPPKHSKKILEVSCKINNQKVLVSEMPDPRYYQTAKFYEDKQIKIRCKNMYTNERVAQLDESFLGKEKFTGDSMMIADLTKQRKHKSHKFLDTEKENRQLIQEMIIKDKAEKNKEAIQETQLVNIDAEVTNENKVDINKIKEIRLALRRRYANRSSIRKIFKDWDNLSAGEINLYNAHNMINKLGIPINYNETLALIASSNKRHSESLNLEEFIHLIFSDNNALDLDLEKIKFREDKYYAEGEQIEKLKKKMRANMMEVSKTEEINFLKEYLRIRIPILAKYFQEECENGQADLDSFSKVIKKFPIHEKYTNENILKNLFNNCNINDNMILYKDFMDKLISSKEINDFYNFKEKYIQNIKYKIDNSSAANQESLLSLRAEEEEKRIIAKELEKEIKKHNENRHKEFEERKINEVNNLVPSTAFINKIFSKKDEYFKKHQELEKAISPHPSLLKGN
jgi:hypothetical protein